MKSHKNLYRGSIKYYIVILFWVSSVVNLAAQEESRKFRYTFSSDLGFMLGFNGTKLQEKADDKIPLLKPNFSIGSTLRYGFSATLSFGMFWPFGPPPRSKKPSVKIRGYQHTWALGFQLRNMLSIGTTSLTYYNTQDTLGDFYSQQDVRAFYSLQPVVYANLALGPLWSLHFYLGPAFNWNFYQKSLEEFYLITFYLIKRQETGDPELVNIFSLGAVAGIAFTHYFYSFLALGIGTQFLLNISPQSGVNAAKYSLGEWGFFLSLYASF